MYIVYNKNNRKITGRFIMNAVHNIGQGAAIFTEFLQDEWVVQCV
jgi:hypothetical protein